MIKRSLPSRCATAMSFGRSSCSSMAERGAGSGDRDPLPQLADGAVATVGTFDGVHLGHRDILRRLHERASARGLPPVVVTFRPHPLEVVNPSAAPLLLTPDDEQLDALADSGPL